MPCAPHWSPFPYGRIATKLANAPLPTTSSSSAKARRTSAENPARSPYSQTAGDRLRVGYGKLTVYLGAAPARERRTPCSTARINCEPKASTSSPASSKRTAAKRPTALLDGLDIIPDKTVTANGITYSEFDRDALIARKPQVALIDELAHTNAPGSIAPKRYHDVLAVLRAGIDVITTLNIQHLEVWATRSFA